MAKTTITSWFGPLGEALLRDRQKAGILGVLLLVLLFVCGRVILGQSHPTAAAGSMLTLTAAPDRVTVPSSVSKSDGSTAVLRAWLSSPIPQLTRNDFLVKSKYYPAGAARGLALPPATGFWQAVEKFISVQADQKEKRDAAIATLKTEAAALRPTSTVMGPSPRAMVNGTLVREGEMVGSFTVLKIEARGIVVESDGIRLAIPMN